MQPAARLEESAPVRASSALTDLGMSSVKSLASSRCRKFRMVVSSGIGRSDSDARSCEARRSRTGPLHRRVAQRKPVLHKMYSQPWLQCVRPAAPAGHRVVRPDNLQQYLPRDHQFHLPRKTSRRAFFRLPAYPASAKLIWLIGQPPLHQGANGTIGGLVQTFPKAHFSALRLFARMDRIS